MLNGRNRNLLLVAASVIACVLAGRSLYGQEPTEAAATRPANKAVDNLGATSKATTPPTTAEISDWIAQLDDKQYRVREKATQRLLAAGPAALEPLATLAKSDRPEPADRAVWLLQQFAVAKELPLRRAALERLAELKDRPKVVSAAVSALVLIRHQECREAIERLGGKFVQPERFSIDPRLIPLVLVLDDDWKGKREDLTELAEVLNLRQVYVIGTKLTASDIAELRQVSALDGLHLYGTQLEDKDVAVIKTQLPGIETDYRRGGLLGVTGNRGDDGSATAADVPANGAAAAAGIQAGDVIRRFDGKDVQNFRALTDLISTHKPGDEIAIEILRDGATKKMTVKLGQWKTEDVIRQINPR